MATDWFTEAACIGDLASYTLLFLRIIGKIMYKDVSGYQTTYY